MDVFFNRINITNKSVEFFHIMLKSIKGDSFEKEMGIWDLDVYIYNVNVYTYIAKPVDVL